MTQNPRPPTAFHVSYGSKEARFATSSRKRSHAARMNSLIHSSESKIFKSASATLSNQIFKSSSTAWALSPTSQSASQSLNFHRRSDASDFSEIPSAAYSSFFARATFSDGVSTVSGLFQRFRQVSARTSERDEEYRFSTSCRSWHCLALSVSARFLTSEASARRNLPDNASMSPVLTSDWTGASFGCSYGPKRSPNASVMN